MSTTAAGDAKSELGAAREAVRSAAKWYFTGLAALWRRYRAACLLRAVLDGGQPGSEDVAGLADGGGLAVC